MRVWIVLLLFCVSSAWAQVESDVSAALVATRHPGKPDPRWHEFDWHFVEREPFRLHFYKGEEWTARFALPRIEAQVKELTETFGPLKANFEYMLFTSLREFEQTNVFVVSEGVQGVTSTQEPTMAVPFWGSVADFDHVSLHEMVHQFQVQKINALAPSLDTAGAIPLWFIEGMAEYHSRHGVDAETRMYLRDLLLNPRDKEGYVMPRFLQDGLLGFVHVYKVGQAKIDFLESRYGKGSSLRLLEKAAKELPDRSFENVALEELKIEKAETLETEWRKYLDAYLVPVEWRPGFGAMLDVGEDSVDSFRFTPDGEFVAYRTRDPYTGITSIRLLRFGETDSVRVAHDRKGDVRTLYALEGGTFSLSRDHIAYAIQTTSGPALEVQRFDRDDLDLHDERRILLTERGLHELRSLSFDPSGERIAFIGIDTKGWANVYLISRSGEGFRKLTDGPYFWRGVQWTEQGLFAASDRQGPLTSNLYQIDPASGTLTALTTGDWDIRSIAPNGTGLVLEVWTELGPELQRWENESVSPIARAKTGYTSPIARGHNELYALGLQGGLTHPVRVIPAAAPGAPALRAARISVWEPELAPLPDENVQDYHAFRTAGLRIDQLGAALGTGGSGGIVFLGSDLMRNYTITGILGALGDFDQLNGEVSITSRRGRTTWSLGGYTIAQPQLSTLTTDDRLRTYVYKEYGAFGQIQQPLSLFSYAAVTMRVGGVSRGDFSDPDLLTEWEHSNRQSDLLLAPGVLLGYDSIAYELFTGPVLGTGLLLEYQTNYLPNGGRVHHKARLDGARYFQLANRLVLAMQGIVGGSFGESDDQPGFYVFSDDILRAYPFGDERLLGRFLGAVKTDLRFPIGDLFSFPPLRGLLSYDIGSVALERELLSKRVTSSWSWGIALNLPPLSLQFIFSNPIKFAPGPDPGTVSHFMLSYLYF